MTCSNALLHAHSVYFSYGNREILRDVTLSLFAGEILAVTGDNGAGKSTLLELMADARTPDHGWIERRTAVSLVLQRPAAPASLPMNVRDVVAMGSWRSRLSPKQRRSEIRKSLGRVDLQGCESQEFSALSGGQRQRVLVAQGLAQGAQVLLLDEPLSAVDANSRALIHEVLRAEARQGTAVALVTHDADSQALADRCLRLQTHR